MTEQAGDQQYQHTSDDSGETVKEEFIRQQIDDRVCVRIEEPVVVSEHQMVKGDEKSLPVNQCPDQDNGNQNSGKEGNPL